MAARRLTYVGHPYGGRYENLSRAIRWLGWLHRTFPDRDFVAPWIAHVMAIRNLHANKLVDEANEHERGLEIDLRCVGFCDDMVLVGGRVSPGMERERKGVREGGQVIDLTFLGENPPGLGGEDAATLARAMEVVATGGRMVVPAGQTIVVRGNSIPETITRPGDVWEFIVDAGAAYRLGTRIRLEEGALTLTDESHRNWLTRRARLVERDGKPWNVPIGGALKQPDEDLEPVTKEQLRKGDLIVCVEAHGAWKVGERRYIEGDRSLWFNNGAFGMYEANLPRWRRVVKREVIRNPAPHELGAG